MAKSCLLHLPTYISIMYQYNYYGIIIIIIISIMYQYKYYGIIQ